MPNAFVQQKTLQSTSSVSSLTTSAMTVSAATALAAATSANGGHITLTVTDSHGDAYLTQTTISDSSSTVQWDLATSLAGGSTTFTVTPSTPLFVSIAVQEYSGVAASPVETTAADLYAIASQVVNPGPLSPPSVGDLYLSAWTHNGSGSETFTPNTGWTLRSNLTNTNNMPLGSEELIESGLQTGSATLSGSAASQWVAAAMALRAADVAAPDDGDSPNYVVSDFPMTARGFGSEG